MRMKEMMKGGEAGCEERGKQINNGKGMHKGKRKGV